MFLPLKLSPPTMAVHANTGHVSYSGETVADELDCSIQSANNHQAFAVVSFSWDPVFALEAFELAEVPLG